MSEDKECPHGMRAGLSCMLCTSEAMRSVRIAPVAEPRTPSQREALEEKAAELIRESIMEAYEGFLHHGMFKVRAQRIARQIAALRAAPQPAPTREQMEKAKDICSVIDAHLELIQQETKSLDGGAKSQILTCLRGIAREVGNLARIIDGREDA